MIYHNYLPNTDESRQKMLDAIGASSQEDLFKNIPEELQKNTSLVLPESHCELEIQNRILELAQKNIWPGGYVSFLGAGCYNRYIPSVIDNILSRVEFLTAYTPYQPEISQGTLQAIYEFQTMICNLTGMDVSNASMYDGATATAEAILMSCRITKKNKTIVSRALNPETQDVIKTYLSGPDIDIITAPINEDSITDINNLFELTANKDIASIVIQVPNFLGNIEEVRKIEQIAHNSGALFVVIIDPISVGMIKPPGAYGADIVTGDGQSLGNNMMYGGPAFGFMACRQKHMRNMPGRIVGSSLDSDRNTAYTLTLQTREQHIRRDKATSNICTNHSLCALAGSIYLSTIGPKGLKEIANICFQRAHFLANKISEIEGFKIPHDNFFNEFIMILPDNLSVDVFNKEMLDRKIIPGINLNSYYHELPGAILISVTEKNKPVDLYLFLSALRELVEEYVLN